MSRQLWLGDVVADAFRGIRGFQVDTFRGWQSRSARTQSFAPIGVMNHHTGPGRYDNLLNYMCLNAGIAPLCNIATSRPQNGIVRITICAAGRANHAGRGNLPWTGVNGGNYRTIGIENQNDGREAWPGQQVEAIHILSAALMKHLGVGMDRLVDHKTYAPGRKPDRHSVNVNDTRRAVLAIIRSGHKPAPKPEPEPEPLDEWEVFWMSLNEKEKEILKDFINAIEEQGTNAGSFVRQLLKRHREDIPVLNKHVRDMNKLVEIGETSLQGVVVGGVNAIDAVRDMGYEISTTERTGVTKA